MRDIYKRGISEIRDKNSTQPLPFLPGRLWKLTLQRRRPYPIIRTTKKLSGTQRWGHDFKTLRLSAVPLKASGRRWLGKAHNIAFPACAQVWTRTATLYIMLNTVARLESECERCSFRIHHRFQSMTHFLSSATAVVDFSSHPMGNCWTAISSTNLLPILGNRTFPRNSFRLREPWLSSQQHTQNM